MHLSRPLVIWVSMSDPPSPIAVSISLQAASTVSSPRSRGSNSISTEQIHQPVPGISSSSRVTVTITTGIPSSTPASSLVCPVKMFASGTLVNWASSKSFRRFSANASSVDGDATSAMVKHFLRVYDRQKPLPLFPLQKQCTANYQAWRLFLVPGCSVNRF